MESETINGNVSAPSLLRDFQKELTQLGGTFNGLPRLRIVWGQDVEKATVLWQGRRRMRYLHKAVRDLIGWRDGSGKMWPPTMEPPTPDQTSSLIVEPVYEEYDVGIPRWFFEQLIHPDIACLEWDEKEMGPPPTEGFYEEAFYMVASHENCCGPDYFRPGCVGQYRAPEGYDLEYVRWLLRQLDNEPYRYDWNEIPPPEVVAQAIRDREAAAKERSDRKIQETADLIADAIRPHIHRYSGHKFRYYDIGEAFQQARKF